MRLTIRIPPNAICLVHLGQKVDFTTPFYKKKTQAQVTISISEKLRVSPKKIFSYITKYVGDNVEKNELLAIKKDLFGTKKIISADKGIIKAIDHEEGKVVIENMKEDQTTYAFFKGEIEDAKKDSISLNVGIGREFEIKTANYDFGGETFLTDESSLNNLSTQSILNKIIVSESISSYLQTKLETLGAKALVTQKKLNDFTSHLSYAQVKSIEDMKKILTLDFSCCYVDKIKNKIYFYG